MRDIRSFYQDERSTVQLCLDCVAALQKCLALPLWKPSTSVSIHWGSVIRCDIRFGSCYLVLYPLKLAYLVCTCKFKNQTEFLRSIGYQLSFIPRILYHKTRKPDTEAFTHYEAPHPPPFSLCSGPSQDHHTATRHAQYHSRQ